MFTFVGEVWEYEGEAAWFFITLPVEVAEEVRDLSADVRRGFGSVRVRVRIGSTRWSTSVFPDKSSGSYVLPVKKAVRVAECLEDGSPAEVELDLVGDLGA